MREKSEIGKQRFPDFIIGGAPKCGTTSVHFILSQNAAVGIPEKEVHYFDADDPITHPDFFFVENNELIWFDPRANADAYRNWYASQFAPIAHKQILGEDSTTYIFSESAPDRIKAMLPDVQLIFMLRDPVQRAYSQYWHLMHTARIACSFEEAIAQYPSIILGSTFAPHLRRYFDLFGSEKVRVALFEDFMSDQQGFMDGMTSYIGAPQMSLESAKTWFNRTLYPKHPKLHRMANRIGKPIVNTRYHNHMEQRSGKGDHLRRRLHSYWFRCVNPLLLTEPKAPPMRDDTARYLTQHLSARNAGLSKLLERDLSQVWKGFEG